MKYYSVIYTKYDNSTANDTISNEVKFITCSKQKADDYMATFIKTSNGGGRSDDQLFYEEADHTWIARHADIEEVVRVCEINMNDNEIPNISSLYNLNANLRSLTIAECKYIVEWNIKECLPAYQSYIADKNMNNGMIYDLTNHKDLRDAVINGLTYTEIKDFDLATCAILVADKDGTHFEPLYASDVVAEIAPVLPDIIELVLAEPWNEAYKPLYRALTEKIM